ncbi:MAG TPA: YbaN family protein [Fluviicola sp.]|nr:YbaN family protein [Fluviicola sp.]
MRYFWLVLGIVSVGLGIIGIPLPLLPTTPFFLLAVFSFSKSSDKFHKWFVSTKMYKDYIESYRPGRPIPLRKKLEILTSVLLIMIASFYFISNTWLRFMFCSIFLGHILYFTIIIKTKKEDRSETKQTQSSAE